MIHRGHGDHGDQGTQDGEGVHHVHHVEDTILCFAVFFIFIPHNVGGVTMGHCYLERVGKSVKYRDSKGYGGEETKEK